jgi:hypothetical protein
MMLLFDSLDISGAKLDRPGALSEQLLYYNNYYDVGKASNSHTLFKLEDSENETISFNAFALFELK